MQPIPKPPTLAERVQIPDRNDEIGVAYPRWAILLLVAVLAFLFGVACTLGAGAVLVAH